PGGDLPSMPGEQDDPASPGPGEPPPGDGSTPPGDVPPGGSAGEQPPASTASAPAGPNCDDLRAQVDLNRDLCNLFGGLPCILYWTTRAEYEAACGAYWGGVPNPPSNSGGGGGG